MGKLLQLRPTEQLPSIPAEVDPWLLLTDKQRNTAQNRLLICNHLMDLQAQGRTINKAFQALERRFNNGNLPPHLIAAIAALYSDKKMPNRATVYRWIKSFRNNGINALATRYTGSQRKVEPWHQLALTLYANPAKPSMNSVARKLREDHGFDNATDQRVRSFINAQPKQRSHNSGIRLGYNEMRKTTKTSIERKSDNLPVGFLYQGDGHTIDVYLSHPNDGMPYRAEMTVWLDIKSRYVVNWEMTESESTISTMTCLSNALIMHDHVPGMLYIDNGSGFKSKIMANEQYGFYSKFTIEIQFAIPGNPGAKGNVERFFRIMEEDFCKDFGEAYCGKDILDYTSSSFVNACNSGKKQAPSLEEFKFRFTHWLNKYHNRPHTEYPDTTPAKMWSGLEKVHLEMLPEEVNRPRKPRVVVRECIIIDNRKYHNPILQAYNGDTVMCEFAWDTDAELLIMTEQGQFICNASLTHKQDHIPDSRVVEAQQKRLDGQTQRLKVKLEKKLAKSRAPITAQAEVQALEQLDNTQLEQVLTIEHEEETADEVHVDIFDTNYE